MNTFKDLGFNIPVDSNYSPYPNKSLALAFHWNMLLDIIDNLPRLRMSSNQFKMILWILSQCNVADVPSYNAFRSMQDRLRGLCGSEPVPYTSSIGNRFFVNDIRDSIARDFANPEIAKHLQFYPEETDGPISEVWQAERWKEFKPSELTPMFARGLRQFYIDEVAELDSGKKVIPLAWIKRGGELCTDCLDAIPDATLQVSLLHHFAITMTTSSNGLAIKSLGQVSETKAPEMPNPLRKIAEGDDLYVVMVPMWADDVSGNKSKQYNKHINMYMANSNLPGRLLQQEYFVRFVSTSPHATSPEQFSAIKEQVQATHEKPIPCYNADTQRNCRVILRAPSLPADNPQQSEEASHMGGNANCGCRRCKAGGTHEITESDKGYHSLHYAGVPRFAAETKEILEQQIELAMYGVEAPISRLQTATGVKDKVAQHWIDLLLEKARKMKADSPGRSADSIAEELKVWFSEQPGDKVNPLLDIAGLDPNRDTPVELLHTILLGIIKYVWYILHSNWSEEQQNLFVIRLQSTDVDGLTVPAIRAAYMMQYRNGLIGKHFKTLMQTMVFHMHDLVSPEVFTLVKAVSALGSILWDHEIDDMAQYALHLLLHIVEDAIRFGPPIRTSTEIFECFNAIFRLCSILSNHQVPSRDIAFKFASMDCLKHILSGGFWKQDGQWVCAGSNVRNVLKSMPIIQHHLGWTPPQKIVPGKMRLASMSKSPQISWKRTQATSAINNLFQDDPRSVKWRRAVSVMSKSGDSCSEGSWIFVQDSEKVTVTGRIRELLVPDGDFEALSSSGIIVLERFAISERLHPDFGMPVLQKPEDTTDILLLSTSILFCFSAQHDCRLVKCQPTALRPVMQERQETSKSTTLISHGDDEHFIVNMAALHNGNLLRRALPRALTVPRPLYLDRKQHHYEVAVGLRSSQAAKRAKTQEKRKATIEAKKAAQRDTHIDTENKHEEGQEFAENPRLSKRQRQRK
ncbi:hypothetical protein C8J57DRAFT_1436108 [Mycena rebaudengoi]|nr:hypothetical protein C8J57DRAFT_1436108 [Mycena rebaudengoi]